MTLGLKTDVKVEALPVVSKFLNNEKGGVGVVEIIEYDGKQAVNARELHQKLGNKRKFADWIKQRIEQYGFVENQDYEVFHKIVKNYQDGESQDYGVFKENLKNTNGGRSRKEYALSLDMAKELCMIENNEQGRLFRKYFIEVEEAARAKYEQENLDKKVSDYFDIKLKWLNFLPGYLNLSDVSKLAMAKKIAEPLGLPTPDYVSAPNGAKHSATYLLKSHNVGLSARKFNELAAKAGLLELKERKGTSKVHKYCEITKKGLAYGENDINEKNMNQVQPHWYDNKFDEVLSVIGYKPSEQSDMFVSGEAHK
jgi:phage anti-repressor protein